MSTERLLVPDEAKPKAAPPPMTSSNCRIFDELPTAEILAVSRPDTTDISPMLLSYTFEIQYRQFKWRLQKKASQVLYLHFALKKRLLIEEFHEKQEQVREWLHSLGIVDQVAVVQDEDEPDDGAVPLHNEESVRNRNVPSRAALSLIRPSIGKQQSITDTAKSAMQGYLNLFLGNLDIVNSREVCKFLEVSRLSFAREYGPKLKEGYLMVKHLRKVNGDDANFRCCPCNCLRFLGSNWTKVWAVLKPGFLAFLEEPFGTKLLDIIVFDASASSTQEKGSRASFVEQIKGRYPLRYAFEIFSGNRGTKLRTTSSGKVKEWVGAVHEAAQVWSTRHRFASFAPIRGINADGSEAQWFVDGEAAFEAIASAIETAKSEIFMTGWWVCPELYLRRPFKSNLSSRLDYLLGEKARQGVKIYILLYKEVAIALKINSLYSKRKLLSIHENVRVLRYPDHLSTGVYSWSHHEKIVIVDYRICFIGGLDLCFGRYDTVEHRVSDLPSTTWPGKDYYNPRESEPNSWEDTTKDELDRRKYPRMPWHDIHCALWGPPCRDIARHFVQRWNHSKGSKAPNEKTIPLLMPQHHMVLPHYMGAREISVHDKHRQDSEKLLTREDSFSSRSPSEDIPLLLPRESEEVFPSKSNGTIKNEPGCAPSAPDAWREELGGRMEERNLDRMACSDTIRASEWGSETSEESERDEAQIHLGQVGPRAACRCQVIRSVSQWSAGTTQPEDSIHKAYISLIENAKHFIYIENQFFISGLSKDDTVQNRILEALYRRILQAHVEQSCFRVIIVLPLLPGFQGGIDDFGAATVRALMHWQYRTISRENTSILHNLYAILGPKTRDYISFNGLRSYGRLSDNGPVATSQVYVHSKLMIVDDRIALIGSSNINDRSLLGSRDSEIGVVFEDKEFVESSMNGKKWEAGKFAYALRCSLWAEHLGLQEGEVGQVSDPVAEYTYKNLWLATAEENTKIYQDVFSCIPNEAIRSRAALRQKFWQWKEKNGHTTIDLGIAPERVPASKTDRETKSIDPMERLKEVKGHLVSFPLNFMCEEDDLRPTFNESEFYASPLVFH